MNRRKSLLVIGCAIALLVFWCGSALADRWIIPKTRQYHSSNKQYYLEVVPKKSRLEKAENLPQGTLFKTGADGKVREEWTIRLVNEVAPVSALVSNDGDYVITFDNWFGKGRGDDVIVIYGAQGRLIKKYALEDILSADEIKAVPRTTSSRHWGGQHYIDETNKRLILKVVSNREMPQSSGAMLRELKIDLTTGNLIKE
ncbi:MAG: hypothetical protein H0U54_13070 [Acidobacteria bacterium]|nr:hypothetical protein [Acidobacteriota bacterium]